MPYVAPYEERLTPSPSVWLTPSVLAILAALTGLPFGPVIALAAAVVFGALGALGLWSMSKLVSVSDETLRAGGATLPLHQIGEVTGFTGRAAAYERGPGANYQAYLCIQGWVDPLLKIEVCDPGDPTPYWLVSTRHPQALANALGAGPIELHTDPR